MSRAGKRKRAVAGIALAGTTLVLMSGGNADAYVTKRTQAGALVHWPDGHVSFGVDRGLVEAVSGAEPAVAAAAQGWSGAMGAPAISVAPADNGALPKVDGKNSILYAAQGYAPAGTALAITVLSYDESTGAIVDADIVVNGQHAFAILAPGATAPAGALPVSTEGSSGATSPHQPFDLEHVVAHELGHALGLGDDPTEPSALMYPYTLPEDASRRSPASDDLAGIEAIYGSTSRGCGRASVVGAQPGARDAWVAWALLGGIVAWRLSRRSARIVIPLVVASASFVGPGASANETVSGGAAASETIVAASLAVDATARVTRVETTDVDGIFETVVELAPERCARPEGCPARVRAHAWGGTLDGITQVVGEMPAPRVHDEVDLALARTRPDPTAVDVRATVLAVRRP
jgi:hypothetical protein